MTLKIFELLSILLTAMVAGVFFGPWVALSRSLATFAPEFLLPLVSRMSRNLAPVMTVLMPAAILSVVPVLFLSYGAKPAVFYESAAGLALLVISLLTTLLVEVPVVKQIESWTMATLPANWQERRDRWLAFHSVRILSGFGALLLLTVAAIFD